MGLEYLLHRRGPLTIPPALGDGVREARPLARDPDLQFVCYPG